MTSLTRYYDLVTSLSRYYDLVTFVSSRKFSDDQTVTDHQKMFSKKLKFESRNNDLVTSLSRNNELMTSLSRYYELPIFVSFRKCSGYLSLSGSHEHLSDVTKS